MARTVLVSVVCNVAGGVGCGPDAVIMMGIVTDVVAIASNRNRQLDRDALMRQNVHVVGWIGCSLIVRDHQIGEEWCILRLYSRDIIVRSNLLHHGFLCRDSIIRPEGALIQIELETLDQSRDVAIIRISR